MAKTAKRKRKPNSATAKSEREGDLLPSERMPFAEALTRAGSVEALLSWLCEVPILAWHQGLYQSPSGKKWRGPARLGPGWWPQARVDPTTRRVIFLMHDEDFFVEDLELFAFGIELERGVVEARFPAATEPTPRHAGGKDPEHNWEGAAGHVDAWVRDHGPLPRHKNGAPIVARAVGLMTEWFEDNDPPAPKERTIQRWIGKNPRSWW